MNTLALRFRQFRHLSVPRAPNRLFPGELLLGLLSTTLSSRPYSGDIESERTCRWWWCSFWCCGCCECEELTLPCLICAISLLRNLFKLSLQLVCFSFGVIWQRHSIMANLRPLMYSQESHRRCTMTHHCSASSIRLTLAVPADISFAPGRYSGRKPMSENALSGRALHTAINL